MDLIHPLSGFSPRHGTFHSKHKPVPLPLDPSLTLPSFLLQSHVPAPCLAYIDAPSGHSLTYHQLRLRIRTFASGLSAFGLLHGHVVLILSPNSIRFPLLVLAVMLAGGIVTLANPLNTPPEIAKQISDSGAKFVCTVSSLLDKLTAPALPLILLEEDLELTAAVTVSWPSPSTSLTKLLAADPAQMPPIRARQQDTAALLYSSGTTGVSKGVIITHKNLIAQASLLYSLEGGSLWPDRVYLCIIPMFHVYGLGQFCSTVLTMGCTTVIMPKFDIEEMLAAIQRYRVTHFPMVPPILLALTKLSIVDRYDLSSLRQIVCGAAPLGKEVISAFRERFPKVSIKQGYGLTESTALGANSMSEETSERHDSVGWLVPNTQAKIVDIDSGNPLPPNRQGELWLRGPTIMQGYFGNPGATAATIDPHGWLHTGDLCYFDEQGYLYIVDRLKELIKYKGFQVAPAEIEAILLSHPEIIDAAVTPFPDEEAGQIPMAYVVRSPRSTLTGVDVIGFVSKQVMHSICLHSWCAWLCVVAPYKKIRRVVFSTTIPKSSSGKILRRDLMNQINSKL